MTYAAPSGNIPAGHLRGATYDAVLPSGRIVTPAGESVLTGMNALGVALTPDGRFAIVSNDDEREGLVHSMIDSGATGGFSLAVVELASMRVVDRYRAAGEKFWVGVAALPDPADATRTLVLASGGPTNVVYAFDLDANGKLTADATHVITPPAPSDDAFADKGHSYPGHDRAVEGQPPRVRRERSGRDGGRDRHGDARGRHAGAASWFLSVRRRDRRRPARRDRRRPDALREAARSPRPRRRSARRRPIRSARPRCRSSASRPAAISRSRTRPVRERARCRWIPRRTARARSAARTRPPS